jgi:lipoyl(octanoyl) transferase
MRIENWGLIEYGSAVSKQMALLEAVHEGEEDTLVFCSHPAVVTLGRGSVPEDTLGWTGAIHESSRGGRATYHGPNQLVIYPVIDLKRPHVFKERDVHAYLRALENACVTAIREIGIVSAEARTSMVDEISLTGVWIGAHKVASLGIAVRKWITYHGVAVNVLHDSSAFLGIRPCGFSADVMTSLEAELGRPVGKEDFAEVCSKVFVSGLS